MRNIICVSLSDNVLLCIRVDDDDDHLCSLREDDWFVHVSETQSSDWSCVFLVLHKKRKMRITNHWLIWNKIEEEFLSYWPLVKCSLSKYLTWHRCRFHCLRWDGRKRPHSEFFLSQCDMKRRMKCLIDLCTFEAEAEGEIAVTIILIFQF